MINLPGLWWSTDVLMNHKPLPPEPKKKRVEGDFKERLEREMNGQGIQSERESGTASLPWSLCEIQARERDCSFGSDHSGDSKGHGEP
mgnify:CR=1 FL=1